MLASQKSNSYSIAEAKFTGISVQIPEQGRPR
jgi:hypothetical protein